MLSRRAILAEPGRFEMIKEEITPGPDELLVKVRVCGLCNWEINHYHGVVGQCPQPLGHEWAGEVVGMGESVKGFEIGDHVVAMPVYIGFADYAVLDYRRAIKLDPAVKLEQALGEPLKCVVTVTRASNARPGDCGVLYGCGPMGLWCAQILSGGSLNALIAVDTDDAKLELAKKYGVTHIANPLRDDVAAIVAQATGGHMADFVIEGTGVPELLNDCVRLLRTTGRGRVVLMSSHKRPCHDFDFREMVSRSAELIVAHAKYSEDQMEDMRRGLRFLENGVIKMDDIITHRYELADISRAFEDLVNKPAGYIKGIVVPDAAAE
ncbi:MAG: zinc-binding dehydrogenase [Candidatus Pelethousia sp.]|nr:zinc-binding dehydrogenase [Candidatus Pelethousia sp.]